MNLKELRAEIDRCDAEIVRLINARARVAQEIGRLKAENGEAVYAPHREQEVYRKVTALNQGPFPEAGIHAIYREIMSGTLALEGARRISYMGPPGTFSHMAALRKFGSSMEYLPAREIRDVFLAVSRDHADYGVVPIENSTEGSVNQTSDMLMDTNLRLSSEIFLEIHQNLLARGALRDVKRIASHPQPLAQCRNWLAANTAHVEILETISTTAAAEMAAQEEGVAAIASEAAAKIYDLPILEPCIEDRPDNVTRFVVLSRGHTEPTGNDRTSILFSVRHKAGSLADTLQAFKDQGINLMRIESRPCRKRAWEYAFFVDMEGHEKDPPVAAVLDALKGMTHDLVVLGSYPRADRSRPPRLGGA
ncbi:MAG: prephenate dehydratase [Planctomycetota bacterium]